MIEGAIQENRQIMDNAAAKIGFFQDTICKDQRKAVIDLFWQACEPLRYHAAHDFGQSGLIERIRDAGMVLSTEKNYWHTPPADALFLHRKLGGMYLLATQLRARVDVHALFKSVTHSPH